MGAEIQPERGVSENKGNNGNVIKSQWGCLVKLCISGALGHIGSELIRNIAIPGIEKVYIVDNFLTQRYASLFDLPDGIDFVFKEMDILSNDIENIIEECDVLVNLAAVTDAERSFERSEEVEEINKRGVQHVASLCANSGCALLFPSSTSVYGSQSKVVDETCPEEDLNPQSPYADSKIFGERLLAEISRKKELRYLIFRVGTIFGYSIGMRFHTAVNKFIWQASTGQPITVWRTALDQKRPYCGLRDCINAINFFVSNDIFDNQIYNIITTNLTVRDIVEEIKRHVPEAEVSFVDSPMMNQLSYEVSNRKSREKGFIYDDNIEDQMVLTLQRLRNVNTLIKRLDI